MANPRSKQEHGRIPDRAFLFSLLRQKNSVLLESSREDEKNNRNLLFHSPIEVLTAETLESIPEVFHKIENHVRNGKWIAGYIGYECGYHFEKIIPAYFPSSRFPLLWLGVFDKPIDVPRDLLVSEGVVQKTALKNDRLTLDEVLYSQKIRRIKEYILNGDTYQVNFTDRIEFTVPEDEIDFYFSLRGKQHVPFTAFLNLGEQKVLSFSPELFFRRTGDKISCKPMKGTAKRGKNVDEDEKLSHWLRNDEKNRSENLMIVDLMRNDIGRICESGSVTVSGMFEIEKYETVLQMTSTIQGSLKKDISYYDIFRSLFPCGSVTGAPKIRTMQIIHELEERSRGIYCGSIGFIGPENESVFNVAIRTIESDNGKGSMGIGSGIVFDSDPLKEYDECLLKAKFLLDEGRPFLLLETMLWSGEFTFLKEHLSRLRTSAEYFQYRFSEKEILIALGKTEEIFTKENQYRVRLLLSKEGLPGIESIPMSIGTTLDIVHIAPERTDPDDLFLLHKTTNRTLYDRFSQKANDEHIADYLFFNKRNEVTEGSTNNIFIERDGKLLTPPLSCGLLPGVFRNSILSSNPNASEHILTIEDIQTADAVYLCNSVRGWRKVTVAASPEHRSS